MINNLSENNISNNNIKNNTKNENEEESQMQILTSTTLHKTIIEDHEIISFLKDGRTKSLASTFLQKPCDLNHETTSSKNAKESHQDSLKNQIISNQNSLNPESTTKNKKITNNTNAKPEIPAKNINSTNNILNNTNITTNTNKQNNYGLDKDSVFIVLSENHPTESREDVIKCSDVADEVFLEAGRTKNLLELWKSTHQNHMLPKVSTTRIKQGDVPSWVKEIEAAKYVHDDEQPTAIQLMFTKDKTHSYEQIETKTNKNNNINFTKNESDTNILRKKKLPTSRNLNNNANNEKLISMNNEHFIDKGNNYKTYSSHKPAHNTTSNPHFINKQVSNANINESNNNYEQNIQTPKISQTEVKPQKNENPNERQQNLISNPNEIWSEVNVRPQKTTTEDDCLYEIMKELDGYEEEFKKTVVSLRESFHQQDQTGVNNSEKDETVESTYLQPINPNFEQLPSKHPRNLLNLPTKSQQQPCQQQPKIKLPPLPKLKQHNLNNIHEVFPISPKQQQQQQQHFVTEPDDDNNDDDNDDGYDNDSQSKIIIQEIPLEYHIAELSKNNNNDNNKSSNNNNNDKINNNNINSNINLNQHANNNNNHGDFQDHVYDQLNTLKPLPANSIRSFSTLNSSTSNSLTKPHDKLQVCATIRQKETPSNLKKSQISIEKKTKSEKSCVVM